MSFDAQAGVWRYHRFQPGTMLVLVRLAFHADANDHAWPKVSSLARDCNRSERQVQRDLRELEEAGALVPVGQHATSKATIYLITAAARARRVLDADAAEGEAGADDGAGNDQGGKGRGKSAGKDDNPMPGRGDMGVTPKSEGRHGCHPKNLQVSYQGMAIPRARARGRVHARRWACLTDCARFWELMPLPVGSGSATSNRCRAGWHWVPRPSRSRRW